MMVLIVVVEKSVLAKVNRISCSAQMSNLLTRFLIATTSSLLEISSMRCFPSEVTVTEIQKVSNGHDGLNQMSHTCKVVIGT